MFMRVYNVFVPRAGETSLGVFAFRCLALQDLSGRWLVLWVVEQPRELYCVSGISSVIHRIDPRAL